MDKVWREKLSKRRSSTELKYVETCEGAHFSKSIGEHFKGTIFFCLQMRIMRREIRDKKGDSVHSRERV